MTIKTFMDALNQGDKNAVAKLLQNGFDVNVRDKQGFAPLHWAVRYEANNVISQLLSTRALKVNSKDNLGNTALHWAARLSLKEIIDLLIDHGADVNEQDAKGCTALYRAVEKQDEDIVKFLLDKGVDPNVHNNEQDSPLLCAVGSASRSIMKLLLDKGADPNIKNVYGRSPLQQLVIRHGQLDTQYQAFEVKSLLIHGADPKQMDVLGRSACEAMSDGFQEWDKQLLNRVRTQSGFHDADEDSIRRYLRLHAKRVQWNSGTREAVATLDCFIPAELQDEVQNYLLMFKMHACGVSDDAIQMFVRYPQKMKTLDAAMDAELNNERESVYIREVFTP